MGIRTWLLPAVLTAGQLLVWPGVPMLSGDPVDRAAAVTTVVAVLAIGAALLWRRTAPVPVLAVVVAGLSLATAVEQGDTLWVVVIADIVALYSVAVHRRRRTALWAAGATLLWQSVIIAVDDVGTVVEFPFAVLATAVIYALAIALGRLRRRWRADRAAAARRLADAEARRREAAEAERHRLARELHDVTAHHLTSIVVSVSAAQHLGDRRPELRREALDFAARTGRETLQALHRLVSVMQLPGERPASPAEQLADLADGFVRLGQRVTLRLPEAELPARVADAVHGIAREALTNTLRYAPGAAVRMAIGYDAHGIELVVENDAPPAVAAVRPAGVAAGLGGGRGLAGMRERATALGGTVEAGPRSGGWRVRALLPRPDGSGGAPPPAAAGRVTRRLRSDDVVDGGVIAGVLLSSAMGVYVLADSDVAMSAAEYAVAGLAAVTHAVPLWWRRRRPWPVFALVAGTSWYWSALVVAGVLPDAAGWLVIAGGAAEAAVVYAAGAYGGRPRLTVLTIPAVLVSFGTAVALVSAAYSRSDPLITSSPRPDLALLTGAILTGLVLTVMFTPLLALCWGAGALKGSRAARVRLREDGAVAQATARAVASAADERVRVAAGLRAAVLAQTGHVATAADAGDMDGVLTSAREALTSMRGLLNGLRQTGPDGDGRARGAPADGMRRAGPDQNGPDQNGPDQAGRAGGPPRPITGPGSPAGLSSPAAQVPRSSPGDEPSPSRPADERHAEVGTPTAPEPGLLDLERLAARLRTADRAVSVTVPGGMRPLPLAVDVSAYRVVETLLTGGTGPAAVHVTRTAGGLRLTVAGVPADPDGVRAAALQARVAALGGTCRTAPADGTVEVFLPVADVEVGSSQPG